MRALGLDVGDRRIGLAIGDSETGLALPAGAIERDGGDGDYEAVIAAATKRDSDTLVVGMPLSMSGARGPQAVVAQAFADALAERTSMNVCTWDERLTSVEADRLLRDAGRGGKRKGVQDAVAASIMLQAFLDARAREKAKQAE
jgi:putative Holliday junction resolvase